MKQKELAFWLKFIIIGTAICGGIVYAGIIPHFMRYLVEQNSILEKNVLPWLITIWVSAIPCYIVLLLGWLISSNIGRDNSFSIANARHLKWVSYLAVIDVVYYFAVNGIFLLIDMSHPFAAHLLDHMFCWYCIFGLFRSSFSSGRKGFEDKRRE